MGRCRSAVWSLACLAALVLTPPAFAAEEAPQAAPPATAAPAAPPAEAPPAQAPPAETPPAQAPPAGTAPAGAPAEAPATPVPEVEAPPTVAPVVVSIEVVGAQLIPTKDILSVVGSEVGQAYSDEQATRDQEAIRALGWFSRVTAEREVTESGIRLIFRVTENEVITDIRFEGVTLFKPDRLRAVMETKPGMVYNSTIVRRDLNAIQSIYAGMDFAMAMVLAPSMDAQGVLTIPVIEGQIEAVRVRGNTRTKEHIIRRMIRTKPGDVYNQKRIRADLGRLVGSELFESVQVVQEMGTVPGKVVVVYDVVEKRRTGQVTFGFGYSSVQGAVGFVDLTKTNLGGTAQSVTTRAEFGGRSSYELYYQNPWVSGRTRLNLGLYNRLILRQAVVETATEGSEAITYDERREGGSITFGRSLTDRTTAYLGYRQDTVSASDLTPEERELLGPAFQEKNVSSITAGIVSDVRDFPRNPRRGAYHQFAAEFAGLFGGTAFDKFIVDERRYFPVLKKSTIALRLLGGTETDSPPYLEQFLVGGSESMRGFRNDQFVGTHMAILSAEYRQPLSQNLIGVLFVDIGDAWGGPTVTETAIEGDKTFTAHVGYGFGIRVATPIGPLRLDLGFSSFGTQTHFGLGHVF